MQDKTEGFSAVQNEYDISNLPEFKQDDYNEFRVGTLFKSGKSIFKVVLNEMGGCKNCCNFDIPFFGCDSIACGYRNFILLDEIPDEE